MKLISRLFGRPDRPNLATVFERQRLGRTMPGQTGAMAASQHGLFV